jgi:hypothetical protein
MMKIVFFLLLLFVAEYDSHFSRYDRHRRNSPSSIGKYRISPKTGSRIALPSIRVSVAFFGNSIDWLDIGVLFVIFGSLEQNLYTTKAV